jgi:hypothetical protein
MVVLVIYAFIPLTLIGFAICGWATIKTDKQEKKP